jgi:CheY-like chemotaxis protein
VLEAVNGRQAVDIALQNGPDLILMDIMMPELDGFEATRELRRHRPGRRHAHHRRDRNGRRAPASPSRPARTIMSASPSTSGGWWRKVNDWLESPLP